MLKQTLAGLLACGAIGCGMSGMEAETPVQENAQTGYAVLLIDMQQDFLRDIAQEEVAEEVPYQIEVIRAAQRNHVPVFVLEYLGYGPTIEPLRDAILDSDYQVIIKSEDNGFSYTNLDAMLRERGVDNLILAGINASACVLRTAYGALERGYGIITSPEIIANPKWDWTPDESESWFRFHGTWIEDHDELIRLMDNL